MRDAATPLWFGAPPIFGLLHEPKGDVRCRATAVVVVAPLGYEEICAHSALRRLAEGIAERGFFVLRYDHPGTGNSAGDACDPARVAAWVGAVQRAMEVTRAETGAERVALVGLRAGALFCLAATVERSDAASLVLWAPPASGRAYVRELRALGGFREAERTDSAAEVHQAAGFAFTEQTLLELLALDPLALQWPASIPTLIVPRDDVDQAPALFASMPWAQIVELPGFASALRDPHEAAVPDVLVQGIADWLDRRHPELMQPLSGVTSSPRTELCATATRTTPLVEEAARFGPDDRLFGVVTHGIEPGPTQPLGVIFVNAGAIHHVGMNRNYVRFAREWAERGVTSLRFDLSGLGESTNRVSGSLYSPEVVPDVRAAIEFMHRTHGIRRFVLAGLCAGAYAAFHAALVDERVTGALLINPQTFDFRPGDSLSIRRRQSYKVARWYRRALGRRESWQKALRGDVNVVRIGTLLAGRAVLAARERIAAFATVTRAPTRLKSAMGELARRGTHVLLVYSADDPGLDQLRHELGARSSLDALGQIREPIALELVDGADHTFTSLANQDELVAVLTEHLVRAHGVRPHPLPSSVSDAHRAASDRAAARRQAPAVVASIARRSAKQAAATLLPRKWLVVHGPRRLRRVALTIDDGPGELTREYLDVLAHYDVVATFFLVGCACERYPIEAERIALAGHAVGNHGFTHRAFTKLERRALLDELTRTDALLPTPHRPSPRRAYSTSLHDTNQSHPLRCVRPPHGAVSVRSLFDCAHAGYSTALWSYDSGDSDTDSADEMLARFARQPPAPGDIILLHEEHRHTLEALPLVIEGLCSHGFELVTISDLFR